MAAASTSRGLEPDDDCLGDGFFHLVGIRTASLRGARYGLIGVAACAARVLPRLLLGAAAEAAVVMAVDPGESTEAMRPRAPARPRLTRSSVAAVANLNLGLANVLPSIAKEFDSGQTALNLIAISFFLGLAASVLWVGTIGDRLRAAS